jgi:hypothetical protein
MGKLKLKKVGKLMRRAAKGAVRVAGVVTEVAGRS